MIARISSAHSPVHVRRTIAARDDDRFHVLRGLIVLSRLQAVERGEAKCWESFACLLRLTSFIVFGFYE
jgi:hypothetical protein